jgi:hypothetical protein
MSQANATDTQERTTAGAVIVIASSLLSALLLIAGVIYALGVGQRHEAALAAAGCEPNLSPSGLPCTTWQMLTSQYVTIVGPASRQLNTDAAAYTASEGNNLAAAEVALTAEVTTEQALGTTLAGFPFPPAVARMGNALIQANQTRAKLTAEQARSSSLTQMRSFDQRVQVASAAAATDMTLVHKALDSPPPAPLRPGGTQAGI